jgi:L-2-hydroxyglutarate oxidase LhgO
MSPAVDNHDVVIIGGGHHGLTCGCEAARLLPIPNRWLTSKYSEPVRTYGEVTKRRK